MVSWKDSVAFWLCRQEFCLTERNGVTREAQMTLSFIARKQHAAHERVGKLCTSETGDWSLNRAKSYFFLTQVMNEFYNHVRWSYEWFVQLQKSIGCFVPGFGSSSLSTHCLILVKVIYTHPFLGDNSCQGRWKVV